MVQEQSNHPAVQSRCGRFQVSLWRRQKALKARHDFDAEREITVTRLCVRYSRFNRRSNEWENQTIWCDPGELRDLANALDEFGQ